MQSAPYRQFCVPQGGGWDGRCMPVVIVFEIVKTILMEIGVFFGERCHRGTMVNHVECLGKQL